jgi:hypothetical protein
MTETKRIVDPWYEAGTTCEIDHDHDASWYCVMKSGAVVRHPDNEQADIRALTAAIQELTRELRNRP